MNPVVISALITGGITLLGTVITVLASNYTSRIKMQASLDQHEAVQDERIQELTREVRKHNEFAERIPRLEARVEALERRVE